MSNETPRETRASTLPVPGSTVSKVSPERAGTHLPSMSIFLTEPVNQDCARAEMAGTWPSRFVCIFASLLYPDNVYVIRYSELVKSSRTHMVERSGSGSHA